MINNANPNELIEKAGQQLKAMPEMKAPEWATFVKTGHSKQRQPMNPDWWHVRQAAVLRKIYLLGPVGVSKLRKQYGGRKNMGMAPERFFPGSGNIIRKILQQLEKAGFAKQAQKDTHKGRVITPRGISFLDKIAIEMAKNDKNPLPPVEESKRVEVKQAKEHKPKAEEKPDVKGEEKPVQVHKSDKVEAKEHKSKHKKEGQ